MAVKTQKSSILLIKCYFFVVTMEKPWKLHRPVEKTGKGNIQQRYIIGTGKALRSSNLWYKLCFAGMFFCTPSEDFLFHDKSSSEKVFHLDCSPNGVAVPLLELEPDVTADKFGFNILSFFRWVHLKMRGSRLTKKYTSLRKLITLIARPKKSVG